MTMKRSNVTKIKNYLFSQIQINVIIDIELSIIMNYMLWIAVSETDRSTLAELQYRLLIFFSDAVSLQLVRLTFGVVLGQTQEV